MSTSYKIFIGYVEQDKVYLEALRTHLSPLVRNKKIEVWYDGLIEPGKEWAAENKQHLSQADMILLLVSANAIASDDFYEGEMHKALLRHESGEARVIPIIVRPCHWTEIEQLSKLRAIPSNGKSLKNFTDLDESMHHTVAKIMNIINNKEEITSKIERTNKEQKPKLNRKKKFEDHHKFRCNRTKQDNVFLLYNNEKKATKRLHPFYFYGGDLQSHNGLFQRFVNWMRRKEKDFESHYEEVDFKVLDFTVELSDSHLDQALKVEVLVNLMRRLKVDSDKIEMVLEKSFSYVLENSPLLKELADKDKIFIHFSIPDGSWDLDITPSISRWFIEDFFLKDLPANSPEIFIFQSIEYEEGDKISDEVKEAMREAEYTVGMPELENVTDTDIKNWFRKYKKLWSNTERRLEKREQCRNEIGTGSNMEKVEEILQKIINEINDDEKDQHKHNS